MTALYRNEAGETKPAPIEPVDISGHGLAFRAAVEFRIGEAVLITDGEDVIEAVVRNTRKSRAGVVYGVEMTQSAELPARFVRQVEESFLRLSEEMSLDESEPYGSEIPGGPRSDR